MNDFEIVNLGFKYFIPVVVAGCCFFAGFARWPWWWPVVVAAQAIVVEYFTDTGIAHMIGMPEVSMMGPATKRIALVTAAALAGHWTGRTLRGLFSSS